MPRINFTPQSFSNRLGEIDAALDRKGKWVNTGLKVVSKNNGFVRFLKFIVLPLARMLNCDTFGSVRAHKVSTALMTQFLLHKAFLSKDDLQKVEDILSKLRKKTGRKYQTSLSIFQAVIPMEVQKPIETLQPVKMERPQVTRPSLGEITAGAGKLRTPKAKKPSDDEKDNNLPLIFRQGANNMRKQVHVDDDVDESDGDSWIDDDARPTPPPPPPPPKDTDLANPKETPMETLKRTIAKNTNGEAPSSQAAKPPPGSGVSSAANVQNALKGLRSTAKPSSSTKKKDAPPKELTNPWKGALRNVATTKKKDAPPTGEPTELGKAQQQRRARASKV